MGIPFFFSWWRRNFGNVTQTLPKNSTVPVDIDTLLLDLNGQIHTAAQRIYRYGDYARPPRFLGPLPKICVTRRDNIRLFKDVCNQIEDARRMVRPQKRIIICIDGPAPASKLAQQRKRRFKSARERSGDTEFDSNAITPGTLFMHDLSNYIDWHIRSRITQGACQNDVENGLTPWSELEIIFSNEKAPMEGEQKALNYLRFYGDREESYCVLGSDADLIMLGLVSQCPRFYILREEHRGHDFFLLDIGAAREGLSERMHWLSEEHEFVPRSCIDDFILFAFTVGNDFLPHMPSVEIIEDGIDLMIGLYREVCSHYGHMTVRQGSKVSMNIPCLGAFLRAVGQYEKEMLEVKLGKPGYFPDPLLKSKATMVQAQEQDEPRYEVDIESYKSAYQHKHFAADVSTVCADYLEGLQWVLEYYTHAPPSWNWFYPHNYAPFASQMADHIGNYKPVEYRATSPPQPFQQLLCVLPPASSQLLPSPLNKLLTSSKSPLAPYCPREFKVDLDGKKQEWEGVVLVPKPDPDFVRDLYFKYVGKVENRDKRRDRLAQTSVYKAGEERFSFRSCYGDIHDCVVKRTYIDL
jgi:5'-3' exoribonuclease 1